MELTRPRPSNRETDVRTDFRDGDAVQETRIGGRGRREQAERGEGENRKRKMENRNARADRMVGRHH